MRTWILATALLALSSLASASIVWDFGPGTGTLGGAWVNTTEGQNFADNVAFATATTIAGLNYFTEFSGFGGTSFHFKVLADDGGAPGAVLYDWDQTYSWFGLSGYPSVYEAQFSWPVPRTFAAGTTYWVGVSGNGFEAAQESVLSPGDGAMAQFDGPNYLFMTGVGDQMFQLTAQTSGVPEPATLALAGTVLLGLGLLRNRRRR